MNKIRNIAFSSFLDKGYEATSMRKICKGAGIEQPTLYYFFGSKEGLFFSIINRLWDQYKQFHREHGGKTETLSPKERLFDIFRNSIRFAMENRRSVSFYYRYSLFPPAGLEKKIHEFLDKIEKESRHNVESIIGELILERNIEMSHGQAYHLYYTFVNNQMFNVTFLDYKPGDSEIWKLWDMFFMCRFAKLTLGEQESGT